MIRITAALCVVVVTGPFAHAQVDEGIAWLHDLDEAMAAARETGRPVMTYFTFNTCHWCHKLEEDTFSDPSVIARSRDFIWVKINRDVTPELCKYFNMSAYPTLMVIGDEREKVYRFSGYKLPDAFLPELDEAERRWKLYRAGESWDGPTPRPASIVDGDGIESFHAPSDAVPAGFAFLGERMFIAQMGRVYEVEPTTHGVRRSFSLPGSVLDITTDDEVLYAMTGSWTAGGPIYVVDPDSGDVIREIVTETNKANRASGAKGVAIANDRLYVLEGMRGTLREVNRETGEVIDSIQTDQTWITGLAWTGDHFLVGGRGALYFIDPVTGRTVREIPTNYPLRSIGWHAGMIYLMEQPEFGYDIHHQRVQVWPQTTKVYTLPAD